jgi:hypothetical protein
MLRDVRCKAKGSKLGHPGSGYAPGPNHWVEHKAEVLTECFETTTPIFERRYFLVRHLREAVPRLSRIGIFGVPGLNALQFAATERAARAVGVEAEFLEVRVPDDFHGAMEAARAWRVEAGILLSSPLVFTSSKLIAELALAKRLPLISLFGEFPKNGGLIAYGPNISEMFRRCGQYVGRVLHGADQHLDCTFDVFRVVLRAWKYSPSAN